MVAKTKRMMIFRFLLAFGMLAAYAAHSAHEYGLEQGLTVTLLTWTFFVFCTPIGVADILLSFPLRLVLSLRMAQSQLLIWGIAIASNAYAMLNNTTIYFTNDLLEIFYNILSQPFPYWSIIGLCAIGTYLSLKLADDVVDDVEDEMHVAKHKHHSLSSMVILGCIIVGIIILYAALLSQLGVGMHMKIL